MRSELAETPQLTSNTHTTTTADSNRAADEQWASLLRAEIDGLDNDTWLSKADLADPYLLGGEARAFVFATGDGRSNIPVVTIDEDGVERVADALPEIAEWSEPGFTWAPAVATTPGGYVLYYTTRHVDSGLQCISVAISEEPDGPYVDRSAEPLVCAKELGGSIDPSPVQNRDGDRYLLWKSDGNCCRLETALYSQRLDRTGTAIVGTAVRLVTADQSWEDGIVEAPSMSEFDGTWFLVYSANDWDSGDYAIGYAVCDTVAGPCHKPSSAPLVELGDDRAGPGGAELVEADDQLLLVYHEWSDAIGYDAGGRRTIQMEVLQADGDARRLRLQATS